MMHTDTNNNDWCDVTRALQVAPVASGSQRVRPHAMEVVGTQCARQVGAFQAYPAHEHELAVGALGPALTRHDHSTAVRRRRR